MNKVIASIFSIFHATGSGLTGQGLRRKSIILVLFCALLLSALPTAAIAASGTYHYVQPRETLSGIAAYFGVSVQALVAANGLANPNHIYVGQALLIPTGSDDWDDNGSGCVAWHSVGYGQTLSGIAAWFGVSTHALSSANNIWNPNHIYAGMKLCIPAGHGHPNPSPSYGYYTVKAGDTLSKIALWHGTTVHQLMWLNHLPNPNYIYVGQVLQVG